MTPEQKKILDFVRGRSGVETLASLGIRLDAEGEELVIENPNAYVASASPADVAEGLLALASHTDDLRRWATLLLAGSPFVDLELDEVPYGDVLLEGLWDASAGQPVRAAALLAAKELSVA